MDGLHSSMVANSSPVATVITKVSLVGTTVGTTARYPVGPFSGVSTWTVGLLLESNWFVGVNKTLTMIRT